MMRQVVPRALEATPTAASPPATPRSTTGWSRPLHADFSELATLEAEHRQWARIRRHLGGRPPPSTARFADGTELLRDGTELHLARFGLADAMVKLSGQDDPAFTAMKAEFKDVLAGPPAERPPALDMELVLETGDRPMPRSRPVKRLSEGELMELRKQLTDP